MKVQWMGNSLLFGVLFFFSGQLLAAPAAASSGVTGTSAAAPAAVSPTVTGTSAPTPAATSSSAPGKAGASTATPASPKVPALEPIAQVIWVNGLAKASQPGGPERALERRSPIYARDLISVDAKSSAEIAFTDSSVVSLLSGTQFKVHEYVYKKTLEDKTVMELVKGGFRTITGAIPKENPDAYQVKTPVATIGVRGTKYTALLSKLKGLLLSIDIGKIIIANDKGTMELQHCESGKAGQNCNMYAQVTSQTQAPKSLQQAPDEINSITTTITPVPANFGPPSNGPGGNGPGSNGPGSSPSNKPSNSFCIGSLCKKDHANG